MTRICSLGREKYSRCIATSYMLTGRAIRTNIPDMNQAWYLTDQLDFLNSTIITGKATNNPTAKRHQRIRNHLRRGQRQKAKALDIVKLNPKCGAGTLDDDNIACNGGQPDWSMCTHAGYSESSDQNVLLPCANGLGVKDRAKQVHNYLSAFRYVSIRLHSFNLGQRQQLFQEAIGRRACCAESAHQITERVGSHFIPNSKQHLPMT